MRETTWLSVTNEIIEQMAPQMIGEKSKYVDFSIPKVLRANVRVYANSNLYLNYLGDNFPKPDRSEATPSITLYYDSNSLDAIKKIFPNLPNIETPCIGLFDETNNTGLITGLDEYGLLTSTVIGMHSRVLFKNNWNPIHGAAVQFENKGLLLIGHHGAGKSTALLNLIHRSKNRMKIGILTDDWSVARREGSSIKLQSIESKMSFSEKLVRENPELGLADLYEQYAKTGIGKLWIDIDQVFGKGIHIQETELKMLLIFSSHPDKELISNIAVSDVADLLVDSAYHMPDCGPGFKDRQLAFWTENLDKIECIQINNRNRFTPKDDIYNTIINYILK